MRQELAGDAIERFPLPPLGAAVVLREFRDEFRMALPAAVQGPAFGLLAPVARLRGYPRRAALA